MNIRRAKDKDIDRMLELLSQVLEIHAAIRPDFFIPGTTKYSREELQEMIADDSKPIFAAVDENDRLLGYAFCQIHHQPARTNMVQFKSLHIDDLCVDEELRGQHIGSLLFDHVREEAKKLGCYEITLNVWKGNDAAQKFYDSLGFTPLNTKMEYIL